MGIGNRKAQPVKISHNYDATIIDTAKKSKSMPVISAWYETRTRMLLYKYLRNIAVCSCNNKFAVIDWFSQY